MGHLDGPARSIIIMHGIAASSSSMDHVVSWIKAAIPSVYVKNAEVGDGKHDSIWWNLPRQLDFFCQEILADSNLVEPVDMIGYSQGGLVARGLIEKCDGAPAIRHFITWSTPHGGQFGIPILGWDWLVEALEFAAYEPWLQNMLSVPDLWRDPFHLDDYAKGSIYLAPLNNEVDAQSRNSTYRERISALASFTMVMSVVDDVITPREAAWFWACKNASSDVIPLRQRALYLEDLIGLRSLDEQGRLFFYQVTCRHQDYPEPCCKEWFDKYTLPFLLDKTPQISHD